jgi:uncharacterized protein (TIGR02246 family)
MSARAAREISEQLAAAVNAGAIQEALELWEPDAKLIFSDGSEVCGREAIGAVLQSLLDNGAKVEIDLRTLHQTATTALASGTLTIRHRQPGGETFTQSSDSLVVYRRGEDGYWRVAIDFPWGIPTS